MRRNVQHYFWLIAILLLAAGLRFYQLGESSLWADELATWRTVSYDTLPQVMQAVPGPWPPGQYIFIHYVMHFIGDSEFALRFPPAVSGILSVAVLFVIGRRLFSVREGMIAAVLLAVMWFGIYYSQEARAYSGLLFFILLATYFWIVIHDQLKQGGGLKAYMVAGYVIPAALAMYWHYFGMVIIGLHGLVLMIIFARDWEAFKRVLVIGLFLFLVYSPWLPNLMQDLLRPDHWVWVTPLRDPLTEGYGFLLAVFHRSRPLMALALVLIGWYAVKRYLLRTDDIPAKAGTDILLLLWFLLPITMMYVKSVLLTPTFVYRYVIVSIPAAYLLLSRAITSVWQRPRYQMAFTGVLVSLMVVDLFFFMQYYDRPKEEFREIVKYIAEQDEYHEDTIVVGLVYTIAPESADYIDYYLERYNLDLRVDLPGGRTDDILKVAQKVCARQPRYIWFISGHDQPDADFLRYLNTHFDLIEHRQQHKADAWLFETASSDPCQGNS
jgi:mannosyltransferase